MATKPGEIKNIAHLLPPVIIMLANDIGMDATLSLVDEYGGTRVYIPAKPINNKLATIISADSYQHLCHQFSGTYLEIPRCPKLKHTLVFQYRDEQGMSFSHIARSLQLTERWVRHIYHGTANTKNTAQANLF